VKTDQSVERGEKATSSDLGFAEALAGVGPEKLQRRGGKGRTAEAGGGAAKEGIFAPGRLKTSELCSVGSERAGPRGEGNTDEGPQDQSACQWKPGRVPKGSATWLHERRRKHPAGENRVAAGGQPSHWRRPVAAVLPRRGENGHRSGERSYTRKAQRRSVKGRGTGHGAEEGGGAGKGAEGRRGLKSKGRQGRFNPMGAASGLIKRRGAPSRGKPSSRRRAAHSGGTGETVGRWLSKKRRVLATSVRGGVWYRGGGLLIVQGGDSCVGVVPGLGRLLRGTIAAFALSAAGGSGHHSGQDF